MNRKKVVVLSLGLSMLLLTLTYGAVVRATPEERRLVYEMDFLGLQLSIMAPYLAYPDENITVTINITAEDSGDINVEYVHVNIYGLRNETEEISLEEIHIVPTVPYQYDYIIRIPNETAPGLLYGTIEWGEWSVQFHGIGMTIPPPPLAGFVVTYVKNLELEKLQADYDELWANYTELKNYKSDLDSTRNLMYVFIATTVVSAATAFIILMRRPGRLWV